jgi:hypothetical protein
MRYARFIAWSTAALTRTKRMPTAQRFLRPFDPRRVARARSDYMAFKALQGQRDGES